MYPLKSLERLVFLIVVCTTLAVVFSSCVNTRKATYFNHLKDSTSFSPTALPQSLIEPNDILNITVASLNPEATTIFNQPTKPNGETTGYLVESNGTILFPELGSVKAAGLSKEQLKSFITKSLVDKKLLIDPIVSVRFQNFKVTVLGEVKNPTVIPVPSEKISLLEAIGLAGDLTIYAKRDNVLVIREEKGEKTVKRMNLNSTELFTSPYYYLKSNDVIYVEPNKSKVASAGRSQQWLPVVFSALSFFAILADRIFIVK